MSLWNFLFSFSLTFSTSLTTLDELFLFVLFPFGGIFIDFDGVQTGCGESIGFLGHLLLFIQVMKTENVNLSKIYVKM